MAKEGSTVSGLMDAFATTVSVSLQYGVPLRDLVNKFAHVRFEPSGFTGNSEIPIAKSIVDYIFRWLGSRFLSDDDRANLGLQAPAVAGLGSAPSPLAAPSAGGFNASVGAAETLGDLAPSPAPATDSNEPKASAAIADKAPAPYAVTIGAIEAPKPEKVELGYLATVGATSNGHANGHTNGHSNGNGAAKNGGGITLNLGGTKVAFATQADAPSCMDCGSIMVRNGSCYKCLNCGSTSGCS
jgi:ribonucleoside-diphosphate reductase alpha chain